MASAKKCSVENCKGKFLAKGYCQAHYMRLRVSGDVRPDVPIGKSTPKGVPYNYMVSHMWDECPKWPFQRDLRGSARIAQGGRHAALVQRIVCEIAHGPAPSPEHDAAHSCGKGHEGCFGAACLRWATRKENVTDTLVHGNHPFAKINERIVEEIRSAAGSKHRILAEQYGISVQTVGDILRRRTWQHVS
jgi:hypothetical protein